ncbi:FG-GAP-like repeat-containing protein [Streptomyces sp. NPDC005963]|uniref:FG-GAP-like repeat-containing protein n=1 Tax=Streptomyces sp. NPDC005963 TaxID=3156721 RepID=UPI0033DC7E13
MNAKIVDLCLGEHTLRKRTLVTAIAVTSACLAGAVTPAVATPSAAKTAPKNAADFNRDGYRDLVITAPTNAPSGAPASGGAVVVLYGSAKGVDPGKRQIISQESAGVPGSSEYADRFGAQAVSGDYDGDGYADLAVSISGEDMTIGGVYRRNAGQTVIIWGGRNGLVKHGATTVKQLAITGPDVRRGTALAAGDFNGDGKTDLATGDYSQGRGGDVLYGPITRQGKPKSTVSLGLKDGQTYVHPSLDSGDVTGDGISDLVVQVFSGRGTLSRIEVHRGTAKGLVRAGNLTDAQGKLLESHGAGRTAVGDLDKDGHADIVVGQAHVSPAGLKAAGQISVVYGGKNGQSTTRPVQVLSQDTEGVPGVSEDYDAFGRSVAVDDINGDGYADVAVGATADYDEGPRAGEVTTLLGSPKGLTGTGGKVYDQAAVGTAGNHVYDMFGAAVKLTDLNGDRRADLLVGAPKANRDQGRISLLPGSAQGSTVVGAKVFGPTEVGLPGFAENGFGWSFGE